MLLLIETFLVRLFNSIDESKGDKYFKFAIL